jgi:GNAT superfamily N-acetyltransferase
VSWLRQPDNSLLAAVEGGKILAVGSVTDAGQITLNCVSPDARFRGVSRVLLEALEARAVERGNTRCTLTSTETARRFYRANGCVEDGDGQTSDIACFLNLHREVCSGAKADTHEMTAFGRAAVRR